MKLIEPPFLETENGDLRNVGVELEFTEVNIQESCYLIKEHFGGDVHFNNPYSAVVKNTSLGTFKVELDTSLLKDQRYKGALEALGIDTEGDISGIVEKTLDKVLSTVFPFEIVAPPIPITKLDDLDKLVVSLRKLGALGTNASAIYAFGAHLNIEARSKQVEYILNHLRAFILLVSRLRKAHHVNLTRRLSTFIQDYPDEYVKLILSKDYAPDMNQFVSDYIEFNPSRDRALDLVPLLSMTHKDLILKKVDSPHLIQARPTFHYRLPNCDIDNPNWSITLEWNRWVQIEHLAYNTSKLEELMVLKQTV